MAELKTVITILLKGCLTISLFTPSKLKEMLHEVKKAIQNSNPDYDIFIEGLYFYCVMQLVTFTLIKNEFSCLGSCFHTTLHKNWFFTRLKQ